MLSIVILRISNFSSNPQTSEGLFVLNQSDEDLLDKIRSSYKQFSAEYYLFTVLLISQSILLIVMYLDKVIYFYQGFLLLLLFFLIINFCATMKYKHLCATVK